MGKLKGLKSFVVKNKTKVVICLSSVLFLLSCLFFAFIFIKPKDNEYLQLEEYIDKNGGDSENKSFYSCIDDYCILYFKDSSIQLQFDLNLSVGDIVLRCHNGNVTFSLQRFFNAEAKRSGRGWWVSYYSSKNNLFDDTREMANILLEADLSQHGIYVTVDGIKNDYIKYYNARIRNIIFSSVSFSASLSLILIYFLNKRKTIKKLYELHNLSDNTYNNVIVDDAKNKFYELITYCLNLKLLSSYKSTIVIKVNNENIVIKKDNDVFKIAYFDYSYSAINDKKTRREFALAIFKKITSETLSGMEEVVGDNLNETNKLYSVKNLDNKLAKLEIKYKISKEKTIAKIKI